MCVQAKRLVLRRPAPIRLPALIAALCARRLPADAAPPAVMGAKARPAAQACASAAAHGLPRHERSPRARVPSGRCRPPAGAVAARGRERRRTTRLVSRGQLRGGSPSAAGDGLCRSLCCGVLGCAHPSPPGTPWPPVARLAAPGLPLSVPAGPSRPPFRCPVVYWQRNLAARALLLRAPAAERNRYRPAWFSAQPPALFSYACRSARGPRQSGTPPLPAATTTPAHASRSTATSPHETSERECAPAPRGPRARGIIS